MKKLILVRHVLTEDNKLAKLSGHIDSKVSEEGKIQIEKITGFLSDEKIDKIYTTTSSRTKETAKYLAKINSIEIQQSKDLQEINFGDFEGKDFKETIKEIASIVDGAISGEVNSDDAEGMIVEGREIAAIHPNMVVKIPMTGEGLKAVKVLTKEGIKTNVTLIFSATQALLAARAGATYVSPFLGRLDDISTPGMDLIRTIAEIFAIHNIETEIIAASVRNPIHVIDAALAGADIATVPTKVIEQMLKHPLTDQGIEKFKKDWEATFGK